MSPAPLAHSPMSGAEVILCCAADGSVPGVRPCVIRGRHRAICADYLIADEDETTPRSCSGCHPQPAERGFLCARHFEDVDHAYARWDEWRRQVQGVGHRAARNDTARRSSAATGFVPLSGWQLAADECDRLIASLYAMPRPDIREWVNDEQGARDALRFARAAERAYRNHETRERPHRIPTVRCPRCSQKTLVWLPPVFFRSEVSVSCQNDACGHDLTQTALEAIADIETETERTAYDH